MSRVFDGLKVIDCASFIAAPAAATILSDFGADVIKIEPPGTGDAYRQTYQMPGQPRCAQNYPWLLDSRNKRSLAVDLASDAGQAILTRLVAQSDVFITNFPTVVRRKLRVTHADLAPLNSRLVYASFSGYGEVGAEAAKPGFDTTAWWARSGMMGTVRSAADAVPARSVGGMGDHPSSLALFAGIVMALYRRAATGEGGAVGSSLLANGLWANAFSAQAALCGAQFTDRPPREQSLNALGNHYRCRDGLWLILSIHNETRAWPDLVACLERPDLLSDPRFATRPDRLHNATALVAVLDDAFATRDRADWRARLNAKGIIFDIVTMPQDIADDEQLHANSVLVPFADGSGFTVDSPIKLTGEAKVPPRGAPELGAHTDEILAELGYAPAEITRFRKAAAIG